MARKKPEELRSHRWFGVDDIRAFGHRSRMLQAGYSESDFRGKPVIGIINTFWRWKRKNWPAASLAMGWCCWAAATRRHQA